MSSPRPTVSSVALDDVRPRRSARRAATVERLTRAAVEEIRAEGYDGLTVRNVARRAGVAPATAYIHFTSKDHLVAEAFWRMLRALAPPDLDAEGSPQERVAAAIADIAQLVTGEPEVTTAATTAVLANQPDVAQLRRRIGALFRERFAAALAAPAADRPDRTEDRAERAKDRAERADDWTEPTDARADGVDDRVGPGRADRVDGGGRVDERVLDVLDLAFSGALVRAGVGEMSYADLGPTMAAVAQVAIR